MLFNRGQDVLPEPEEEHEDSAAELALEHMHAKEQYEAIKADVLERAAARQANLRAHVKEVNAEIADLDTVLDIEVEF